MRKLAVVAAGGTGGHLFPAQALAEALMARGWGIILASDERVAGLAQDFPAERRIPLSAATFRRGDPIGMLRAGGTKRHKELLAPFGLDATDPAFWAKGLGVIEGFIDQLEQA